MNWVLCRAIAILVGFAGEQLVGWPRKLYHPIMAIGPSSPRRRRGSGRCFPRVRLGSGQPESSWP